MVKHCGQRQFFDRASMLRSRVRASPKFWYGWQRRTAYHTTRLQMRQEELCTRSALKGAHRALYLLEGISGLLVSERLTSNFLYHVANKELLSTALEGRPRAAKRRGFPLFLLVSLEGAVLDCQVFRLSGCILCGSCFNL